jgi:hypothetical protein
VHFLLRDNLTAKLSWFTNYHTWKADGEVVHRWGMRTTGGFFCQKKVSSLIKKLLSFGDQLIHINLVLTSFLRILFPFLKITSLSQNNYRVRKQIRLLYI